MSESNPNNTPFDVFLCHNSADKAEIRQIADELLRRGFKPWLDEREIPPGRVWQEVLEMQIGTIKAVAVFAGNSGMGHWQNQEMRACIDQFAKSGRPVIPVILPSATETPNFPLFLQNRHHVDFRKTDLDPIKQLIWGITGMKPDPYGSTDSSTSQAQHSPNPDGKDLLPSKTKQIIELRLPGNVEEFSPEQQIMLMQSLSTLLKLGEVKVTRVVVGSIRLYIELDQADADKLYNASKEGLLRELSITAARLYPAIAIPPTQGQRAQLEILLDRVKEYWVDGVLKQSLYREALISLGKYAMDEAVEPLWKHVITLLADRRHLHLQDRKINTIFDATGLLLILGDPGSGKTTSLLELAEALIGGAKNDLKERVPIVLNLSSWQKNQPLEEWIAVELSAKYRVAETMARDWLIRDYLVPLLDGLDELPIAVQPACVAAINTFIENRQPSGLVVCSRLTEYQWLPERLKLNGAVCIEPLSREDVNKFLAAGGSQLEGLQQALRSDPELQELAQMPLMLSIMCLACEGGDGKALFTHKSDSLKVRRDQIFRLYTNRMFERKGSSIREFSKDASMGWLSWLAQKMREQSQSVFIVEDLQPHWLSSRGQWLAYEAVSSLGIGLVIALVSWLVIGLSLGLSDGFILGLFIGLYVIWVRWEGLESVNEVHPVESIRWEWGLFWKRIRVTFKEGPWLRFRWGLVVIGVMLVFEGLRKGFDMLLVYSFVAFVVLPAIILSFVLLDAISAGLATGFAKLTRADKVFPNQGIKLSLKNGLVTLLYGGIIGGMVGSLFVLPELLRGESSVNMFMWPLLFAMFFGLRVGSHCGGSAVIKHYSLRLILWLTGATPSLSLFIPFLDHCAKLILLKKVGGGYIFIHRTLLEYFAELPSQTPRMSGQQK